MARALILAPLLVLAAIVAACSRPVVSPGDPTTIRVVTTSTVFADLVRASSGERVSVTSLVPAGTDVHTYQAKPRDVQAVVAADLVVMNGLGLDDWLEETVRAASAEAPILRLADGLAGVELLPGEGPGEQNPHLWMDVSYAALYVDRIAAGLKDVAPDQAVEIEATASAYRAKLVDLDAWVRQQIATIPEADPKIVTFHDALPYFARAYGLTIVGVAVEAPGQDPSAGEIAALIDAIRESGAKAIFSEDQFPTALVDQIALETGIDVVADLYDDSLGADPVTSYEALIRWDVERLVEALR